MLGETSQQFADNTSGAVSNTMTTVQPCEIPPSATLRAAQEKGAFADCYATDVKGTVSLAEFVEAFYTTSLFKVERKLLAWFAGRPATNTDAARLGDGTATSFSAWRVESRSEEQLLIADFTGRTQSWLMVARHGTSQTGAFTRLYFGSAVVPRRSSSSAAPRMGLAFHALIGSHKLYSRLLLQAARSKVLANQATRAA